MPSNDPSNTTGPGQDPKSQSGGWRIGVTSHDATLILRGVDLIARIISEKELIAKSLQGDIPSRTTLLDTESLSKLETDSRSFAQMIKERAKGSGQIMGDEIREHVRINNELTKFAVIVLDFCARASAAKLAEMKVFLQEGGSFQFDSAKDLAKLGKLQAEAAEYFTSSGLTGCNLGMVASIASAFSS